MTIHDDIENIRKKLDEEKNIKVTIALFGQPGAGKSSLINTISGSDLAEVGLETDKTTEAGYFEHNGLTFVDLPGYGTKNFPQATYFEKFDISNFDLFLCVTSGKLHQADTEFFQELFKREKTCIFVSNQSDKLWEKGVSDKELRSRKTNDIIKHIGHKVPVLFTSCKEKGEGIDELNCAIEKNLSAAKKERWKRGAKAFSINFLNEKKSACEKYVANASLAAAANGINPIPGADIAVDVGIIMSLFKEIRGSYGLNDNFLNSLKQSSIPVVGRLSNNVVQYAAKEGILRLLKSFAGRQAVKTFSKYIPFVGQAIAAGVGYAITSNAGSSYLKDCHELAEEILKNNLST